MKKIWKYILIAIPLLLIGVVVTMFLLQYPTNDKQVRYAEYVTEGNSFLTQKEYIKAVDSFNKAAQLINNKFDAYEGLSKILSIKHQLGQLSDLIQKSALGLQANELARLYVIQANGYLELNNPQLAKPIFEKALASDSALETARFGYAKTLLLLGETENIAKYLDLPKESSLFEDQYILKLFSKSTSIDAIKEVINENVVSEDLTRKAIIEAYKKISVVDPKEDVYIAALVSRQLINNGYSKLTIKILEPMVDKIMEYTDGVYLLAVAYYNNEEYEKSLSLLKDFSNPSSDPDIYLLTAKIYKKTNDDSLATKNYDLALASAGVKNEGIYKEYIKYLFDEALYNKAKEILDKASKTLKSPWIDIAYLRMNFEQKNTAKAVFYSEKLSKNTSLTDDEKKEYLYWEISQMIETQKFNEGLISLAKLKEIDKTNPKYYLLAGKLHLQTTNVNEAKVELEQAIDYDTNGEVTESAKKLLSRVN